MGLLEKLSNKSEGIVPLAIKYLFDYFEKKNKNW